MSANDAFEHGCAAAQQCVHSSEENADDSPRPPRPQQLSSDAHVGSSSTSLSHYIETSVEPRRARVRAHLLVSVLEGVHDTECDGRIHSESEMQTLVHALEQCLFTKHFEHGSVFERIVRLVSADCWRAYVRQARHLAYNIRKSPTRHEWLRTERIHWLVHESTPRDLYPTLYENLVSSMVVLAQTDCEAEESSLYSCRRCGSRRVVYTQMQTRSADEPMTTYFQCTSVGCHHRWKR